MNCCKKCRAYNSKDLEREFPSCFNDSCECHQTISTGFMQVHPVKKLEDDFAPSPIDWQDEFDKQFTDGRDYILVNKRPEEYKSFIRQTLSQEREYCRKNHVNKICNKCKVEKMVEDFYIDKKSGLRYATCKVCVLNRTRIHHRNFNNPEKSKKSALRRKLRGASLVNAKKMQKKYPEKHKARYKLRNAVASGKIIKGVCEKCGEKKTEGHHDDYTKPLDVRWLCIKHHKEHHRTI